MSHIVDKGLKPNDNSLYPLSWGFTLEPTRYKRGELAIALANLEFNSKEKIKQFGLKFIGGKHDVKDFAQHLLPAREQFLQIFHRLEIGEDIFKGGLFIEGINGIVIQRMPHGELEIVASFSAPTLLKDSIAMEALYDLVMLLYNGREVKRCGECNAYFLVGGRGVEQRFCRGKCRSKAGWKRYKKRHGLN